MNYNFIGEGRKSCAIKFENEDYVSKIGETWKIMEEYENIKLLPHNQDFLGIKNPDLVIFKRITDEERKIYNRVCIKYKEEKQITHNTKLSKLMIPLINGETIESIFESYVHISRNTWYNLLELMIDLNDKILNFNDTYGLNHYDLNLGNIILTEDNNLIVIDFGTLGNDGNKKHLCDRKKMILNLRSLIMFGINKNEKIKKKLINNGIINNNIIIIKDSKLYENMKNLF